MSDRPSSALTPRDLKLLVGFAFFAEVVLGWFFLVDPSLTRLTKLQREIALARESLGALQAAAPAAAPAAPGASTAPTPPPPLRTETSEAAALAIQRHVATSAAKAGVVPVSVTVVAEDVATDASPPPAGVRRADVVVTGSYDAIERFVGDFAWSDVREGIERLTVAGEGKGDVVRAELRLVVMTK